MARLYSSAAVAVVVDPSPRNVARKRVQVRRRKSRHVNLAVNRTRIVRIERAQGRQEKAEIQAMDDQRKEEADPDVAVGDLDEALGVVVGLDKDARAVVVLRNRARRAQENLENLEEREEKAVVLEVKVILVHPEKESLVEEG